MFYKAEFFWLWKNIFSNTIYEDPQWISKWITGDLNGVKKQTWFNCLSFMTNTKHQNTFAALALTNALSTSTHRVAIKCNVSGQKPSRIGQAQADWPHFSFLIWVSLTSRFAPSTHCELGPSFSIQGLDIEPDTGGCNHTQAHTHTARQCSGVGFVCPSCVFSPTVHKVINYHTPDGNMSTWNTFICISFFFFYLSPDSLFCQPPTSVYMKFTLAAGVLRPC